MQKERRHEYETVWVDEEGNELEEPPEELVAATPDKRNGATPKPQGEGSRSSAVAAQTRVPPPPSWRRAARRSLILGAVIFVAFYVLGSGTAAAAAGYALRAPDHGPLHGALHPVHVLRRPLLVQPLAAADRAAGSEGLGQETLTSGDRPEVHSDSPRCRSSVDRYALGPLQTNCYVVRSDRGATEAPSSIRAGTPPTLRLELARLGTTLRRDPRHARPLRPRRRRRRPRRGNRRGGLDAGGRARAARALPGVRAGRRRGPRRTRPSTS